jgi:hypothetical protein
MPRRTQHFIFICRQIIDLGSQGRGQATSNQRFGRSVRAGAPYAPSAPLVEAVGEQQGGASAARLPLRPARWLKLRPRPAHRPGHATVPAKSGVGCTSPPRLIFCPWNRFDLGWPSGTRPPSKRASESDFDSCDASKPEAATAAFAPGPGGNGNAPSPSISTPRSRRQRPRYAHQHQHRATI